MPSIFLNVNGDSLKATINNDSALGYHLICKDLALRYEEGGPVDIFLEGKAKALRYFKVPINLLFLRRSESLYVLFTMPVTSEGSMPKDLLNQITATAQ